MSARQKFLRGIPADSLPEPNWPYNAHLYAEFTGEIPPRPIDQDVLRSTRLWGWMLLITFLGWTGVLIWWVA